MNKNSLGMGSDAFLGFGSIANILDSHNKNVAGCLLNCNRKCNIVDNSIHKKNYNTQVQSNYNTDNVECIHHPHNLGHIHISCHCRILLE